MTSARRTKTGSRPARVSKKIADQPALSLDVASVDPPDPDPPQPELDELVPPQMETSLTITIPEADRAMLGWHSVALRVWRDLKSHLIRELPLQDPRGDIVVSVTVNR